MRKYILIIIYLFLNVTFTFSQTSDYYSKSNLDSIVRIMGSTPDELHWNGEQYLMDRTFLSRFNGYDKLYPKLGTLYVNRPFGTKGEIMDRNYYAKWLLKDSVLYLRNLGFFQNEEYYYPNQKQYKMMEQLVGHKFYRSKDKDFAQMQPEESIMGGMKASWVNGVYYVKKVRIYPQEDLEFWDDKPYHKLTFEKGKMISDEIIKPKNKPHLPPGENAKIE